MIKKFIKLFTLITILFPLAVSAAGGVSVSKTSLNIKKGSTATFTITANNAAGNIVVSSSNPNIAQPSVGSTWIENQTITVTVGGISEGNTTIKISLADISTFDEEVLSGTYVVNVNVTDASSKPSAPVAPVAPQDNRSNNTNLSKVTINDTEVTKVDNNNYYEVSNFIDKVNIAAVAEDSKSKIGELGQKDLIVGENAFDIVVTSERGTKKTHKLIINRSKYNFLKDLDELLKLNSNAEIKISESDKLTKSDIEKIKNLKKIVTFNQLNESEVINYSWIVDGNKIKKSNDFNLDLKNISVENKEFSEAMNYPDGIYLNLKDCLNLLEGITLKYNVGDKYETNDKLNVYAYDSSNKEIIIVVENLKIKDGYIEFDLNSYNEILLSKAKINNAEVVKEKKSINLWSIISIFELVVILIGITYFGTKLRKLKFNNNKEKISLNSNLSNNHTVSLNNSINEAQNSNIGYSNNNNDNNIN
ncbi:MAG: hypothetical protein J6B98_06960 [Bacilli bacterium]|nr:hypothetical protein [Bacilli bacterium]